MIKAISRKGRVRHIYCAHPMTLDKSSSWGPGNVQHFPNGCFLQLNEQGEVTHGVQANASGTAPVGLRMKAGLVDPGWPRGRTNLRIGKCAGFI